MIKDVFLAGGARTAVGSFFGSLSQVHAADLGGVVIKASLSRSGVPAETVDEVLMGNCIAAGIGPNIARQAAIKAGVPQSVPAMTINKVCGSSLKTVVMAAQSIQLGEMSVVVAGGTENMSRAPYLLEKARNGYRLGDGKIRDSILLDALMDPFADVHMGACADKLGDKFSFSREEQDDYAVESYKRALAAIESGAFKDEIVAVEAPAGRNTIEVSVDEEPQRFNEEKLRALRPAFGKEGTVTAGNASSLNDGAAAVTVLSGEKVEELGIKPEAKILAYSSYAREPEWFTLAPVGAISNVLNKLSITVDDVDFIELNEAFSGVPMAAMKELGIPREKMNIHGGAVAIGHPLGASGARVLVTLINVLKQKGGKVGIASLCIGGGQGIAMAIELC